MKRNQIDDNTRAACYISTRRNEPGTPAMRAWERAAKRAALIATRIAFRDAAAALLAEMWEELGKVEPKRYSPEGQNLGLARKALSESVSNLRFVAAYTGAAPARFGAPYAGCWNPDKPGLYYSDMPSNQFRNVLASHDVKAARIGHNGWFDNNDNESGHDGTGLVWGVVAQLPGKGGKARYVAGYRFGNEDGYGVTFDLARMYEAQGEDSESALCDAARAGDAMAEQAAEVEREYQAAYQAGARWADALEQERETRREVLEALTQFKAARVALAAGLAMPGNPAGATLESRFTRLCALIRSDVGDMLESIRASRAKRRELAEAGRVAARGPFCEGAGLALSDCPF